MDTHERFATSVPKDTTFSDSNLSTQYRNLSQLRAPFLGNEILLEVNKSCPLRRTAPYTKSNRYTHGLVIYVSGRSICHNLYSISIEESLSDHVISKR